MTVTVSLRIANDISLENAFILQMIGILLNKYVVLFKETLITVGVIAMFFIFTPDYQSKKRPRCAILQLVDYTCSQYFSIFNP